MYDKQITFELLTNNDNSLTEYHKDGSTYVEARKGSEYKLKIYNRRSQKILAVPTVDGLSIMDGKPGNYNSGGYIIYPYQSIVIPGWRTDLENVRNFVFTTEKKSYSNKSGQGKDNLGIIGLACFHEIAPPISWNIDLQLKTKSRSCFGGIEQHSLPVLHSFTPTSYSSGATRDMKGIATASLPQNAVGTGMGNRQENVVQEETFKKENNPFAVFTIQYKTSNELRRMGLLFRQTVRKHKSSKPNPFPTESRFCKEV